LHKCDGVVDFVVVTKILGVGAFGGWVVGSETEILANMIQWYYSLMSLYISTCPLPFPF